MGYPIKVLHLITWLNPGGIERWLLSMLQKVDRDRVAMDFCCKGPNTGSLASLAKAMGATIQHCPLRPTHFGFVRGLDKIIRSSKYDVVHNHLEHYAGVGVYAAKRAGVTVISGFHNTSFPAQLMPDFPFLYKLRQLYGKISIRYALRHSALISANAVGIFRYLKQLCPFPSYKERVLYYGVEFPPSKSKREKESFRSALDLDAEKVLITHVASFTPQKNHMGLLRVAEKVISLEPKVHFVLVGEGALRPQIQRIAEERGIANNLSFLGSRQDIEHILGCSDMFFLPSHWEGLPRAVLEAMAAKLPIVATDLPGLKETIIEGRSRYLLPINDEEGMKQRLLDLIANPEKRRSMGELGWHQVQAKFSLSVAANNLCKLYESLSNTERSV